MRKQAFNIMSVSSKRHGKVTHGVKEG